MSALSSLFKWAAVGVAVLYVMALGLWAIGTYGLFGQEQDPLSAVFLVPLGLPWNRWFDDPQLAMAAPMFNVIALWILSRIFGGKR